jgi:cytochrome c peroxidase
MFASVLLAATDPNVITTPGASDGIQPSFAFRDEVPFASLKTVATWHETEQMLDNPYATTSCPQGLAGATIGNAQGYAARCTTIQRRRSFLPAGCTYDPTFGALPPCNDGLLPPFLVHPLNYNPATGEQMRLLNPAFPGLAHFFDPSGNDIGPISAGSTRIHPGDAPAIDYNSPLVADTAKCTTINGQQVCGGDAGEPAGYAGAAICGDDPVSGWVETRPACVGNAGKLIDPTIDLVTNQPRGIITSLRRPSIGQAFLVNSDAALAGRPQDLEPSNPDDYIRDRGMATALGKALFWDMQLGSDGVQACASCHFAAGADTRVRDQLNPGHLGGDSTLQVFRNRHPTTDEVPSDQNPNQDLLASDFPTHLLADNSQAGEPLRNPSNVLRDSNDVVGSMGMRLRKFANIQTPGSTAFLAPNNGVSALRPDNGTTLTDPLPIFQGLRRVEPRNTPTIINSAFNYDNFWDGRGRHDFNGGSVFGASDPQSHVFVDDNGRLQKTRQIIRFASVASQMTGPALSEFEMSFLGRSWPLIGKKLLQGDGTAEHPSVTPLAGQLVDRRDSVLGIFSNQGGTFCRNNGRVTASGKPGLCLSYRELIQLAFFPQLWQNTTQHLNRVAAACSGSANNGVVSPAGCDPFDGIVLSIGSGPAGASNRAQFTQMEANFALFTGLGLQAWMETQVSDDTPYDRFLDANPQAFVSRNGTSVPRCSETSPANTQPCLTEAEGFNRALPPTGTPDRLLGMDLFFGTNLSQRNPNFRSARCGSCHAGATLTNNTFEANNRLTMADFTPDFMTPGSKLPRRPWGKPRHVSGFLLEAEVNANAADGITRNLISTPALPDANDQSRPAGSAFFDNGMYNITVRPIDEDVLRGGNDAWGWPLSLATLMLKNAGGTSMAPGTSLPTFNPSADPQCAPNCVSGGLFPRTAQDGRINPGFGPRLLNPQLPGHLAPWVNDVSVGLQHPQVGEVTGGLNALTEVPLIDQYLEILGPYNPAGVRSQTMNAGMSWLLGSWPDANRVGRMGSAKVPQLRNIELTGPYFHNGGKLTLRQVVNFYAHGGDFPVTDMDHKDFNIVNLDQDGQSKLSTADRVALVDFLLSLTDERVAHEQAPFDHPEILLPIDGTSPDNTTGRSKLINSKLKYRRVLAVGAAGHPDRLPAFMNIASTAIAGPNNDQYDQ